MRNNGVKPESNLHVKLIALIKLANAHLKHFPKDEKYALCTEIKRTMYEVYNLVTECNKRKIKKTSLTVLNVKHEQLRMMFKMAHELGYYNYKHSIKGYSESVANGRYLSVNRRVDEIGAMIGGWIKVEDKKGE